MIGLAVEREDERGESFSAKCCNPEEEIPGERRLLSCPSSPCLHPQWCEPSQAVRHAIVQRLRQHHNGMAYVWVTSFTYATKSKSVHREVTNRRHAMNTKFSKIVTCVFVLATALLTPLRANAYDVTTGTITGVDLNADVAGRGLCVAMNPPLPATTGAAYACLYTANPLYKEFVAQLYAAFLSAKACTLWTQANTAGLYNEIRVVHCG